MGALENLQYLHCYLHCVNGFGAQKNRLALSFIMVTKKCIHLFALLNLLKEKEVSSNWGPTRYYPLIQRP